MSELFADQLMDAIDRKGAPVCAGIDPAYELLPEAVAGPAAERNANDAEAAIDAIFDFTTRLLRIVAPLVPCVKFQSAYFERYQSEGVEAYYSLVQEAKELGLLVIGDVKRGDIGTTASAYAQGHLADPPGFDEQEGLVAPDAITVNPMMGLDTLAPFIDTARNFGKGLFVLVRTSNPGSAALQDVALADGRSWSQMLADGVAELAADSTLIGSSGYSAIGAVVGATQPHVIADLRQRLPKSIFLLPGYGAQGATAEMTRNAFENGRGAIVSASRSILYAHNQPAYRERFGEDWEKCVQQAVLDMKADLERILS